MTGCIVGWAHTAFGRLDGETVENLLRRGPMALRTGQQVVTGEDYERLALELEPSITSMRSTLSSGTRVQ